MIQSKNVESKRVEAMKSIFRTCYYTTVYLRQPGTDVMIFKIFLPQKLRTNWRFLLKNQAKICKILIITLGFEKNANFFAKNCRKTQKIVIITSSPDHNVEVSQDRKSSSYIAVYGAATQGLRRITCGVSINYLA
jgi:hypothetical protein